MQIDLSKDREERRARAKAAAAPEVARLEARTPEMREADEAKAEQARWQARLSHLEFKRGGRVEVLLPRRGADGRWQHFLFDPWTGTTYRAHFSWGPRGGLYCRLELAR